MFTYLSINANGASDKLEKAVINFEIKRDWLEANGFTERNVVLQRYTDKWENLPTEYITDGQYRATTPGFSYFAIIVSEDATNIVTEGATAIVTTLPGEPMDESDEVIAPEDTEEKKGTNPLVTSLVVLLIALVIIISILGFKHYKKKQKEQEEP